MKQIEIFVNRDTKNTDDIDALKNTDEINGIKLLVIEEKPKKYPIVSKANLDNQVLQDAVAVTKDFFNANSIVRIYGEALLVQLSVSAFKKIKESIINLISANNTKKGNRIGADFSMQRNIKNGMVQKYRFIFDSIPESELGSALEKIQPTLDDLEQTLGIEYFNKVEKIAFKYEAGAWKISDVLIFDSENS